jgi:Raf kinase inhibitor-like YbhB/YbcL family protein
MSLDRPVAPDPYKLLPPVASFPVVSSDLTDGAEIDSAYAGDGGNSSPQLSWSGFPSGTKSFVVTCFDPDAPTPSGFWHWAVVGIPPSVTELPTGAGDPSGGKLPDGAFQLMSDTRDVGYAGPYPPAGDRPHRYFFVVHAVDVEAFDGVDANTSNAVLSFNLVFHTLARGQLVGRYQIAETG